MSKTNNEMSELLPCAHCGSTAKIKRNKTTLVSCTQCTASTFQSNGDVNSAITTWNRRRTFQPISHYGQTQEQERILFAETLIGTTNIPDAVVSSLPAIMSSEWRIWKAGRASVQQTTKPEPILLVERK